MEGFEGGGEVREEGEVSVLRIQGQQRWSEERGGTAGRSRVRGGAFCLVEEGGECLARLCLCATATADVRERERVR